MSEAFFEKPILNSPYDYPERHWELDPSGQPTGKIDESRRKCDYVTPIPKGKKKNKSDEELELFTQEKVSVDGTEYDPMSIVNEVRTYVDQWRNLPQSQWQVTAETARLLAHWRQPQFSSIRPFFCQVEAVETAIWLAEVAPKMQNGKKFRKYLEAANAEANPLLFRIALKLATGAGKTMVMAMLIAWQTVNAVRRPGGKSNFSRAFLIIAPGITIRDRLRVLLPNDPESYYAKREILPRDMLPDMERAKIVITNYHSFQLREKVKMAAGTKKLVQGRTGPELKTKESEGEMVRRVMGDLMGLKNIVVINDEAHHCYRERVGEKAKDTTSDLKGDEKKEAQKQNEYARLWISGIEAVKRKLGVQVVYDLSATPFFLSGSGYREGTLFPWVMSDFSLMDAIECGIVKLPRVPISDNVPNSAETMPKLRTLWEHIGKSMPKKGRGNSGDLDPEDLPTLLKTALEALYGHYTKTFELWDERGIEVPPVFIVVCNNTTSSKLVYDYVSGWEREKRDGSTDFIPGKFELFQNHDSYLNRLAKPRTLLIDSEQLESGDALDKDFRAAAGPEIERFRREIVERTGNSEAGKTITDQDLLREVMNTVGSKGQLGESIRCVVSVSMLTEGWDANTVTHILGVRAFGTQLLCEQVVGRGLRRQSYELNEEDRFDVEYSDVLGIPFDFTAKPMVAPPKPPPKTTRVHAVRPDRDALEIRFPRVDGYRTEIPNERLSAAFSDDHTLVLSPETIGSPSRTVVSGIIGETVELNVKHLEKERQSTILFKLTTYLIAKHYRDDEGEPQIFLFGQLKPIVRQWLANHLECKGDTYPAQILIREMSDRACERIISAINSTPSATKQTLVVLNPYNPVGTSSFVNFTTSKELLWETDARKCQINYAVCDSEWERQFCRALEAHPRVVRYVKNQALGLEVPYSIAGDQRRYFPDYIVCIDDGNGPEDLLHLIAEVKGYRREDVKDKQNAIRTYWVPGVNNLSSYGRWAFAEFADVDAMDSELETFISQKVDEMIEKALHTD